VLVADNHPIFLEAVGRALESRSEFQLVGLANDGREALEAIRALAPGVAVVEEYLPFMSGLGILRAVRDESLGTRVLILTRDDSSALVYEAMQLGAAGFVTKTATLTEIYDAVAAVADGGTVLGPQVQAGLVRELRTRAQATKPAVLTEREQEVLRMVADGLSAPEIAARLAIGPATVRTHVKNLQAKLDVNDRAAAVAKGMRRGLLD